MPREYHIDRERGAIFVSVTGVFTEREFTAGTASTVGESDFHPDLRTLVDFSGVTRFDVSAKALEDFVRKQSFSRKSLRAFVVGSGFGATFVTFGKTSGAAEQIQIFRDRAGALTWLNEGVPPEKVLA